MAHEAPIGIIGGMGPRAGLNLVQRIIDATEAHGDQDHVPVVLLSYPNRIPSRGAFLLGEADDNPAVALTEIALELDRMGVAVAGIASHAAHAAPIFDAVVARLEEAGAQLRLLHLIDETIRRIQEQATGLQRIGVLSTLAVYRRRLFANRLAAAGFTPILPEENVQEHIVNRTIYDPSYGLKAQSNPVSLIARQSLVNAIEHLRTLGAEAVILGCNELSLAIPESELQGVTVIDPTRALARALLRETYPKRLKP